MHEDVRAEAKIVGLRISRGALGDRFGLTPTQRSAAFAATRRVLEADGLPLRTRSADLLLVVRDALGVVDDALPALPLLASLFSTNDMRRSLVDALVIAACIEGEVSVLRQREVERIALELEVNSHWSKLLDALRRRHVFTLKRALVSRAPDARRMFARVWDEEGVRGIFRALVFVLGFHRDTKLAKRYRSLSELPVGSFGRVRHRRG